MNNKKDIIHIASEVFVISSVFLYFYKQNKNLNNKIEKILNELKNQQEINKKYENIIMQLVDLANKNTSIFQPQNIPVYNIKPEKKKNTVVEKQKIQLVKPDIINEIQEEPKIQLLKPDTLSDIEEESEPESDLDAEMLEELNELEK